MCMGRLCLGPTPPGRPLRTPTQLLPSAIRFVRAAMALPYAAFCLLGARNCSPYSRPKPLTLRGCRPINIPNAYAAGIAFGAGRICVSKKPAQTQKKETLRRTSLWINPLEIQSIIPIFVRTRGAFCLRCSAGGASARGSSCHRL